MKSIVLLCAIFCTVHAAHITLQEYAAVQNALNQLREIAKSEDYTARASEAASLRGGQLSSILIQMMPGAGPSRNHPLQPQPNVNQPNLSTPPPRAGRQPSQPRQGR